MNCANDHHARRGFWHGRTCKGQSNYLLRECHPRIKAPCGGLPQSQPVCLPSGTPHTKDAAAHICHGCASKPVRIYGVQQGLCRTSRSVWLQPLRVPHRTCRQLALDSRGKNTDASVSSASFNLLGAYKKPHGIVPMRLSVQSFMILLYNAVMEKASTILLITCHTEARPDAEPHGSFCCMRKTAQC